MFRIHRDICVMHILNSAFDTYVSPFPVLLKEVGSSLIQFVTEHRYSAKYTLESHRNFLSIFYGISLLKAFLYLRA